MNTSKKDQTTIQSKRIIYDDTCPMCQWYTGAFVKYGLLEPQNRVSFTELNHQKIDDYQVDSQKARHEIPLVDLNGGEPLYGLDSLVFILKNRFPMLGKVMQIGLVNWFFRKLYTLVSYNRRVMAPTKQNADGFDCTPDFNMRYRMGYICIAWVISAFIGFHFTENLLGAKAIQLFLGICGAWFIHYMAVFSMPTQPRIEYWGQLATIKLIGTLSLLPGIWIVQRDFLFFNLGIATMLMFWQYLRRVVGYKKLWLIK